MRCSLLNRNLLLLVLVLVRNWVRNRSLEADMGELFFDLVEFVFSCYADVWLMLDMLV